MINRRFVTKALSAAVASALALLPALVSAAGGHGDSSFEAADRAMERGGDWELIVFLTVLGVGALFLMAAVGYLYRRERGLDWQFQQPEAPHDDHH